MYVRHPRVSLQRNYDPSPIFQQLTDQQRGKETCVVKAWYVQITLRGWLGALLKMRG